MKQDTLSETDWLDLALVELRSHGYGALKAQRLAKKLAVTRGSFYYHFENLNEFHTAVVAHWAKRTSTPLIKNLSSRAAPAEALNDLLLQTLRSGEHLERAMRSWATVHRHVAAEVDKVDAVRVAFAKDLLLQCGVPAVDAAARARLLYWAAIGRLMMPFPEECRLSDAEIVGISTLVMSPLPT
ncbi:MAG: TetR/AcrR family transcriptional regulator [Pseudomonadota bacterium]